VLSFLVDAILEDADGGAAFGGSLDDSLAAALAAVRDTVCAPALAPCSLFADWAPGEEVHEVSAGEKTSNKTRGTLYCCEACGVRSRCRRKSNRRQTVLLRCRCRCRKNKRRTVLL
jgi:hypothetical protein